ncbi:MAG: PKD domain-containing protein, partial [Bacteroidales bacterium]
AFVIYCNSTGTGTSGVWTTDRKSIETSSGTQAITLAQYKLFLQDPTIFATGQFGEICNTTQQANCDGSIDIKIKVNKPGKIEIKIDIEPLGPGNEDVVLTQDVVGSANCSLEETIHWNGNNGLGVPVAGGVSVSMVTNYLNGLTNLPLGDIEDSPQGIKVDLIRPPSPTGSSKLGIYWDDSNVNCFSFGGSKVGTVNDVTGCIYTGTPTPSGCHQWLSGSAWCAGDQFGDTRTINSWWYYLTTANNTLDLDFIRTPETPTISPAGPVTVCQGQQGAAFSIPASQSPSATSFVWILPIGATIATGNGTNSITVNFSPTITAGTYEIKVYGVNGSCGDGLPSPALSIAVSNNVLPTINGQQIVCNKTTQTYTCPSAVTNWVWNLPTGGGSITSGAGTSTITVDWTSDGSHTIELTSTDPVCGVRSTNHQVTVNPLPNVNFSYSNNCAGETLQFTDLTNITTGFVNQWNWNFGDGNTQSVVFPNPASVSHIYAAGGTYNVVLTATS